MTRDDGHEPLYSGPHPHCLCTECCYCGQRTVDDDHDEALELDALPDINRTIERTEMHRATGVYPQPVLGFADDLPAPTIRETIQGIRDAITGARPCCHTTGPNHHPACQESK